MTAHTLRAQVRAYGLSEPRAWIPVAATALWLVLVVGLMMGLPGARFLPAVVVAFPLGLVAAAVFRRPAAQSPLVALSGVAILISAALVFGLLLPTYPLLALAVPAVVVAGLLCARFPVAALAAALAVSAGFGTLQAYTAITPTRILNLVIAGILAAVVWRYALSGRVHQVRAWPGLLLIAGYLVVTIMAIPFAPTLELGLRAFSTGGWYFLLAFAIAYAGWQRRSYDRLAKAIVVVAFLGGAYATVRWAIGYPSQAELGVIPTSYNYSSFGVPKVIGATPTAMHLGAWTAAVIPFCLACGLTMSSRWKPVAFAACGVCGIGLLGSTLRIGVVGAVAGAALVLALYSSSRAFSGMRIGRTALALVVAAGLGVGAYSLVGESSDPSHRYSTILNPTREDTSVNARLDKWDQAFRDLRGRPLGYGLGTATLSFQEQQRLVVNVSALSADSGYIKVALEQGLAIAVLFTLALVITLGGLARRAMTTTSRTRASLAIGAAGTLASFILLLVTAPIADTETAVVVWVILGIGIAQFAARRPDELVRVQPGMRPPLPGRPDPARERVPAGTA